MSVAKLAPVTPPHHHVLTAREALEPLYEAMELETDRALLSAAVQAGWSPEEAAAALAALRLSDALAALKH